MRSSIKFMARDKSEISKAFWIGHASGGFPIEKAEEIHNEWVGKTEMVKSNSMKKIILLSVIMLIVSCTFIYLSSSFIHWSLNPAYWHMANRFLTLFLAIMLWAAMTYFFFEHNKKKDKSW